VTTRGDRERELAAYERDLATLERKRAAAAAPPDRHLYEDAALAHDEIAQLHERLADVYDREDREQRADPESEDS
jgi:hypothetical protein